MNKINETKDKLYFIKKEEEEEELCPVKDNIKRMKAKPRTRRKHLKKTHLIKDCSPKHAKISESSKIRK